MSEQTMGPQQSKREFTYDPSVQYGDLGVNNFASPGRYIQSANLLSDLGRFLVGLEGTAYVLCSAGGKARFGSVLNLNREIEWLIFDGESSESEILRLSQTIDKPGFIVALGGGKSIDTGKAIAYLLDYEVVVVPTLASNDSPCSALSILYTPTGAYDKVVYFPSSPKIVAVDLTVIAQAPKRYFVSGMGDAMATFYEADSVKRSGAMNCVGGKPTQLGITAARLCRDLLFEAGPQALEDILEQRGVTEAIEKVTEASIMLSGIGFESGGLAAAHGLHNAIVTTVPACHAALHGEKVAFCLIVHLLLEGNDAEAEKIAQFNATVGLPVTWDQVFLDEQGIRDACALACDKDSLCANMGMELTPELIFEMFVKANELGEKYL
mmetsp:Transcript_27585/g.36183  ORF Transcript_27585/g.36183 Transcript_27585/m.36183 type:complete len:381 (+) Transcript_27585:179-1321(+)